MKPLDAAPIAILLAASSLCACKTAPKKDAPTAATRSSGAPVASASSASLQEAPKPIPAPADVAKAPADAEVTASGLKSKRLKAGRSKEHPTLHDQVVVHYTGWTTAGQMFDSSRVRQQPASFRLDRVIPGWSEGIPLMTLGEERRFWIPSALAYGGTPPPGAPAGELVFDVELLEIMPAPPLPPVPENLTSPPANAKTTESGLAWISLAPGDGKTRAQPANVVVLEFTGWTDKGKVVESSRLMGKPLTLPAKNLIPALRDAVLTMSLGEKARIWASPKVLSTPGRPPATEGLVFEVELTKILPPPLPKLPGHRGQPRGAVPGARPAAPPK